MTPTPDIDAIREALEAATKGPWWSAAEQAHKPGRKPMYGTVGVGEGDEARPLAVLSGIPADKRHADAHLIANAPTWLASLLSALDEERRAHERTRELARRFIEAADIRVQNSGDLAYFDTYHDARMPLALALEADDGA